MAIVRYNNINIMHNNLVAKNSPLIPIFGNKSFGEFYAYDLEWNNLFSDSVPSSSGNELVVWFECIINVEDILL